MSSNENNDRREPVAPSGPARTTPDHEDDTRADSESIEAMSRAGTSLVGCRCGDYQILRKLGRGGMADVYAARHLSLGRDVAIKILRSDFSRDQDYVTRFRREARAAAKLNHRNIVQVYDVGSVGEIHYIAQELIDGKNLKELLNTKGSLSAEESIETLVAVAAALDAAAEVGITHRDIKPENIMRSMRGEIKVADFGLARIGLDGDATRANLTQAGLTMGTPRYMSPEQVQGKVVDVRSDLYSLGVTMYHLLAGRPPFEADDPLALAVLHLHETPPPLDQSRGKNDLPEWLVAVIDRLMSKVPGDRFQSPQELLDAIDSEASVVSSQSYSAKGTAAATIRLQRATDAAKRHSRGKGLRVAAMFAFPLLLCLGAAAIASRRPSTGVSELLRPEKAAQANTVEEQFLIAMTRDDEPAWKAIDEYFPRTANSKNLSYYAKSMIQLARIYKQQKRYRDANDALANVVSSPKIDRKYHLVALAKLIQLSEQPTDNDDARPDRQRPKKLNDLRRQLESLYIELSKSNPDAIEFFERVVPREERLWLEVSGTAPAVADS